MGYGEVGILSPSANAFKDPTSQLAAARGEGVARGSYLSQMDQFYAQLDEATRQFDLSYGLQERQLDIQESSDDWRKDFSYAQLEQQGELQSRQLNIMSAGQAHDYELGLGNLGIGRGQLDLQQEQMDRNTGVYDRYGDRIVNAALGGYGIGGSANGQRAPEGTIYRNTPSSQGSSLSSYYDPFGGSSITDYLGGVDSSQPSGSKSYGDWGGGDVYDESWLDWD